MHSYIAGIIRNEKGTPLAIGGWKDHVHAFYGLPLTVSIADFMKAIKANSSRWVNEQRFVKGKFLWQDGYGAFSYAKSQRDTVIKYIMNQEEHHKTKTFREEYLEMLSNFEVEYKEEYLFEFYD